MTGYLLRRILQMVVVLFLSAVATYALLNLAPGWSMSGAAPEAQSTRFRITEEDLIRIPAPITNWTYTCPSASHAG